MRRRLLLFIAILATGCATSSTTLRELPPSLSPATTALLDGCEARPDDDGVGVRFDVDVVCAEGLRLVIHRQAAALEPTWLAFAADEAVRRKTRLDWVDDSVDTGDSLVPLRTGELRADNNAVIAVVIAAARPVDILPEREDLWCSADIRFAGRCKALLATLLGAPALTTPKTAARAVPPTLLGRHLTLATTCAVEQQSKEAGRYVCEGATLRWRTAGSMQEAVDEAEAVIASFGDDVDDVVCHLGYEASRCQAGQHVAAGVAFVDGIAVVASCVGPGTPAVAEIPGCIALLNLGEQ